MAWTVLPNFLAIFESESFYFIVYVVGQSAFNLEAREYAQRAKASRVLPKNSKYP
jgi:hypothetical protein